MIFKGKPRFDLLDQYVMRREYGLALEAISDEIKRRPENFNLLLRQAELLGQAGDREQAIGVYRNLARHYTDQGFFARAIAVTNKILRLDPERQEVTTELAALISAQKEVESAARQRLERSAIRPGSAAAAQPAEQEDEPSGEATAATGEPPAPPPAAGDEPGVPAEPELPALPEVEIEEEPAQFEAPAANDQEIDQPPTLQETEAEQAKREREASQFFAAFPQAALEDLLSSTSVRSFRAAEVIVREGEPGTSLFLIETGTVEVHTRDPRGVEVVLAVLGPGEFFGEVAVLSGVPRTATIIAREPVTVIEVSRDDLTRIAGDHPQIREMLERFYRQRAEATVEAMLARLRGSHA